MREKDETGTQTSLRILTAHCNHQKYGLRLSSHSRPFKGLSAGWGCKAQERRPGTFLRRPGRPCDSREWGLGASKGGAATQLPEVEGFVSEGKIFPDERGRRR